METLPPEMLEMIIRDLTLKDLAHCSAVSRKWREAFNQDWFWERHCDPKLEEPLQTIPSVATPGFVNPQNSTLTPLCRWRKALMREKHLWRIWRCKEMKEYTKENIIVEENVSSYSNGSCLSYSNDSCRSIDFLTDTQIVVWYSNQIKIFDVSVMPAAFVAKIDTDIGGLDNCLVTDTCKLLVNKKWSLEVYSVDVITKSIHFKHTISFDYFMMEGTAVGNIFFSFSDNKSEFLIFDLEIGKKIKNEFCPVERQHESASFWDLESCPSGDFVAIKVLVSYKPYSYTYYIYSLKQLKFLPGPVVKGSEYCKIALHQPYLALNGSISLTVFNFQTGDFVLERVKGNSCAVDIFGLFAYDHFIFLDHEDGKFGIYMYSLSHGSLTNVCNYEMEQFDEIKIINNKFIATFGHQNKVSKSVWEVSSRSVKKSDISILLNAKSNRSFTKVINKAVKTQSSRAHLETWYIIHLW